MAPINITARPGPSAGKIRLATASPATQPSTPETLAALHRIAQQASSQKIDILLLPEAYIGGYPRGTHFGCTIGARTQEGRDEYLAYFKNAVDLGDIVGEGGAGVGDAWVRRELPGDDGYDTAGVVVGEDGVGADETRPKRGDGTREELERIARQTGVFLVIGCIEKSGGSMYCSAVYVCPSRGIIGKRRKVMPTGTERLVWAQGSPATLRAVSTSIRGVRINIGTAICWENYMPLLRQSLYAQNVNLYLAPTADGRDTWLSLLRTIGIEGRCFVVSSNMCVRGDPQPLAIDPPAPAPAAEHLVIQPQQQGSQSFSEPSRRRTSFVTEEGFEIALPPPSPTQLHHPPSSSRPSMRSTKRRKSVFDEDGNEIVLCCKDDNGNDVNDENDLLEGEGDTSAVSVTGSASPTTSTSPTAAISTGTGTGTGPVWSRLAGVAQRHVVPTPPPKPLTIGVANGHAITTTTTTTSKSSQPEKQWKFVSRGGSCIVSPFGAVLAGPQWEDDSSIVAVDVDFDDCIRGRLDLDTAGSYSRNDSFKFSVEGLDMIPLPY